MSIGKKNRLAKLFHQVSGRSVIIPLDHGATIGPVIGLVDICQTVRKLSADLNMVQGLVLHRGVMGKVIDSISPYDIPTKILHLSASTGTSMRPTEKMLVASVEDAIRMGADAVSIHVNVGVDAEPAMLKDFGSVASRCQQWGLPLLAMMYVRVNGQVSNAVSDIKNAARLAAEMGADLVKVGYPGSAEAMQEVVDGCFVPVLIAGGERCATTEMALSMVTQAIAGGAAGVCMGRNLFQHDSAGAFLGMVGRKVHGFAADSPLSTKLEGAHMALL